MTNQEHWNEVYRTKGARDVSWFQESPQTALAMIEAAAISKDAGVIDVGGGASALVDCLLDAGYRGLGVLDISGVALEHSRSRLGARAKDVEWFESDVASFSPPRQFGLWHDRAVFHFMTTPEQRRAYTATLRKTLRPGGSVVISTFAPDGPPKCSGLEVRRYNEKGILAELGPDYRLDESRRETHPTPWDTEQRFMYFRLQAIQRSYQRESE